MEHAAKSNDNYDDDEKCDKDDEDDDDDDGGSCFITDHMTGCRSTLLAFCSRHKAYLKASLLAVLALLYALYFGYAVYYEFGDEPSIRLLWVTCLVVAILALSLLFRCWRPKIESISTCKAISYIHRHHRRINRYVSQYDKCAKSAGTCWNSVPGHIKLSWTIPGPRFHNFLPEHQDMTFTMLLFQNSFCLFIFRLFLFVKLIQKADHVA